jgi:hypothetical protein
MSPLPYEPVSSRWVGRGSSRQESTDGRLLAKRCKWVREHDPLHVRLANGQLVIVRPRVRT